MIDFRRLEGDQGGNVLVIALFMGVTLFASVDMLSGISHTIVDRQNAQTLADAIAGEGAYWHAQGSNFMALINIVMAIILSLFVMLRVAELLTLTFAIIAAVIPPLMGLSGTAFAWAQRLYNIEQRVSGPMLRALVAGTQAERAIAATFPYVGVAVSAARGGGRGFSYSPTLFPASVDRAAMFPDAKLFGQSMKTFPARMGGLLQVSENGLVQRFSRKITFSVKKLKVNPAAIASTLAGSLPVEEEDYQQVCKRASANWGRFPGVYNVTFVEKALGWLGGNLPGLMCEPISEAKDVVERKLMAEVTKGARHQCDQDEQVERDALIQQGKPAPEWNPSQRRRCREQAAKKLEEEGREKARKLAKEQPRTDDVKTARLWFFVVPSAQDDPNKPGFEGLSLDNPFLHVWSQVFGKNMSSAKTAYYPHCVSGEDRYACAENAMWRIRWKYALGVDRDAFRELGHFLGDSVRGYVGFLEGQVISRGLGAFLEKLGGKIGGSSLEPRALWWRRIAGTNLRGKNGKINLASWGDPGTQWIPISWWDHLYFH